MLISIVIPVYNGLDFVSRCYDSIKNQPEYEYGEIEILFVDDGSIDGSSGLLDRWLCIDERITVVHSINRGVSSARNSGLRLSNGKYITFLDQDDLLYPGFYNKEITSALKQSDIDVYGFSQIGMSENLKRCKVFHIFEREIRGEHNRLKNAGSSYDHHSSFLWNRNMVLNNHIVFFNGRHEDETFRRMCLYCANSIKYIDKPVFIRVNNRISESHRKRKAEDLYFEIINTWHQLQDWFRMYFPSDEKAIISCDSHIAFMLLEMMHESIRKDGSTVKELKKILYAHSESELLNKINSLNLADKHYNGIKLWNKHPTVFWIIFCVKGIALNCLHTISRTKIGHWLRDWYFYR